MGASLAKHVLTGLLMWVSLLSSEDDPPYPEIEKVCKIQHENENDGEEDSPKSEI